MMFKLMKESEIDPGPLDDYDPVDWDKIERHYHPEVDLSEWESFENLSELAETQDRKKKVLDIVSKKISNCRQFWKGFDKSQKEDILKV